MIDLFKSPIYTGKIGVPYQEIELSPLFLYTADNPSLSASPLKSVA